MFKRGLMSGLDTYNYIRLGKSSYLEMNKLKEKQYENIDEMKKTIDKKLRDIITFAYENVPLYRELYLDINLYSINNSEQISQLPITSKEVFRSYFPANSIAQQNKSRAIYDVTSGSTGTPFEFFKDRNSGPLTQASFKLFNTWMGVGTTAKFVHLKAPSKISTIQKFRDWIYGRARISVFDIHPSTIIDVIDKMNAIDPVFIEGYTASMVNLASFVLEKDLNLDINPRAIVATSEDLIESQRKLLEDVFQCKVFNRYGSKEFSGAVAQECEIFEGLHVNSALFHLEIVDDENEPVGVGEEGRILITDLNNYVMPFIRYEIGDRATRGPEISECGRVFPIIKKMMGRKNAFFISKNNEKYAFLPIYSSIFGRPQYGSYVKNFQFIQKDINTIVVKIVPTKELDDIVISGITNFLKNHLPDFSINIDIVDFIQPEKSGKRPFFINRIK
jgi:phenylacetate-CoA ligase